MVPFDSESERGDLEQRLGEKSPANMTYSEAHKDDDETLQNEPLFNVNNDADQFIGYYNMIGTEFRRRRRRAESALS